MKKIVSGSLYLVLSEEYAMGKDILDIAGEAVSAGIDILQMREKNMPRVELVRTGKVLAGLCSSSGVIFIVNDDPELANEVGADGVHLGQGDLEINPLEETRRLLGKDRIIGLSTHSLAQFDKADKSECDYVAYGPIFHTLTKDYSIGIGDISEVMERATKPVFFIGGINPDNIDTVLGEGAENIAVIRAITRAKDVGGAVRDLKNKMRPV